MYPGIYTLLDILLCSIAECSITVLDFDKPVGLIKIQTTSKNSQRYNTTKHLIRDLLSNTPNCYVRAGEFRGIYRECVTEVCKVEQNLQRKSS